MSKTLFASALAGAITLCANAEQLYTGTTFAGLSTEVPVSSNTVDNTAAGDLSAGSFWSGEGSGTIVAYETTYSGTRPDAWAESTDEKYLQLQTANALCRNAKAKDNDEFASVTIDTDVYIDTLIQFTACDIEPVPGDGDKLCVWLDPSGYVMVKAGFFGSEGIEPCKYTSTTSVEAGTWHRLTVRAIKTVVSGSTAPAFMIYLDEAPLTYAANTSIGTVKLNDFGAYAKWLNNLYPSLVQTEATIKHIAYEGQGACDDIVFTTTAPSFGQSPVAKVGDDFYTDLASAVTAANGAVITLLADSSESLFIDAGSSIQLNTNGHIYSGEVTVDGAYVVASTTSNGVITYSTSEAVAQIGSIYYASFAEAFASAVANDTIVLLDDVSLSSTVTIDKNLTINLNENDITATDCRAFHVTAGAFALAGTGTVSTVVTQGTSLLSSSSVIRVGSDTATTSFTLGENVTVASGYCYGVTYFGRQAQTVTLNGTVAVTGVQPAISGNGNSWNAAVTLTVNGTVTATQDYAIYNPQTGTTIINGTVTGLGGIEVKAGSVTVNNGAVITATAVSQSHSMNNNGTSTYGYAIASIGNANYPGEPAVTITGGTISGQAVVLADTANTDNGTITATTDEISAPAGYKWVETETAGVYELVENTDPWAPEAETDVAATNKVAEIFGGDSTAAEKIDTAAKYTALVAYIKEAKKDSTVAPAALSTAEKTYIYESFLLGAEELFTAEPKVEVSEVETATEPGTWDFTVKVTQGDAATACAVAAAKVQNLVKVRASLDTGDWAAPEAGDVNATVGEGNIIKVSIDFGDATSGFMKITE